MFQSYMTHLTNGNSGIECIVYNHYIIIMTKKSYDNYIAITILHVPPRYLKIVDRTKERKTNHGKRNRYKNAGQT